VCVDRFKSLVIWTPRNLKLSARSTAAPPVPVVHDQLLGLTGVEGEVVVPAPHTSLLTSSRQQTL
jgi:hypothetical protein